MTQATAPSSQIRVPPRLQDLYRAALEARARSYSPYSGHQVGAALRTDDGRIYGGCNVENSSFGATICAERTAIVKATSEQGRVRITEILVVTDATPPWPPCGICRQIIAEFATPATELHAANLAGDMTSIPFSEIFPQAFTPEYLGK